MYRYFCFSFCFGKIKNVKKGDVIIIVTAVLLALLPLGIRFIVQRNMDAATVTVKKDGEIIYSGSVQQENRIAVPGTGNVVRIFHGNVFMEEADCKDHLCIRAGKASPARPIICLPNGISVTISGSDRDAEYDAVTK